MALIRLENYQLLLLEAIWQGGASLAVKFPQNPRQAESLIITWQSSLLLCTRLYPQSVGTGNNNGITVTRINNCLALNQSDEMPQFSLGACYSIPAIF